MDKVQQMVNCLKTIDECSYNVVNQIGNNEELNKKLTNNSTLVSGDYFGSGLQAGFKKRLHIYMMITNRMASYFSWLISLQKKIVEYGYSSNYNGIKKYNIMEKFNILELIEESISSFQLLAEYDRNKIYVGVVKYFTSPEKGEIIKLFKFIMEMIEIFIEMEKEMKLEEDDINELFLSIKENSTINSTHVRMMIKMANLEMLKFAIANGYKWTIGDYNIMLMQSVHDFLYLLEAQSAALRAKKKKKDDTKKPILKEIKYIIGNISYTIAHIRYEIIKFALNTSCIVDKDISAQIIKKDEEDESIHVNVSNNFKTDPGVFCKLVLFTDSGILKDVIRDGGLVNVNALIAAAYIGDYGTLELLMESNQHLWDDAIMFAALWGDKFNVLMLLKNDGLPKSNSSRSGDAWTQLIIIGHVYLKVDWVDADLACRLGINIDENQLEFASKHHEIDTYWRERLRKVEDFASLFGIDNPFRTELFQT
jgi:hypothetical protein